MLFNRWVACTLAVAITLLSACDDSGSVSQQNTPDVPVERFWVDLVSGSAWELTPPDVDPYEELRAGRESCRVGDFGEEYGGLEVSTVYCDYITLTQPLLEELKIGDLIEFTVWHSPLLSEEPQEGALSLRLGEFELWSTPLAIPGEAKSWTLELEAPAALPIGTSVFFHVRNHGANAYTLLTVRRGRIRD